MPISQLPSASPKCIYVFDMKTPSLEYATSIPRKYLSFPSDIISNSPASLFQCPLAQAAWRVAGVARLSVTSEEAFWRSLSGGFFRREADFCHSVGNLDSPERGCLQGNHPVRLCHYTHRRGVLFFLALRRRMLLKLCTPAAINLAVSFH